MSLALREREKYERCWADPEYRYACHSLALWKGRRDLFPRAFASALDIGCGTGRLFALWNEAGIDAWAFDIAPNCLDPEVARRWGHKLGLGSAWEMDWSGRRFDFGVCTDVAEHWPTERVQESLRRIGRCCDEVLFKVAHEPNALGEDTLHLTLRPASWWVSRMNALGGQAEFLGTQERSGCQDSLIRWRPR